MENRTIWLLVGLGAAVLLYLGSRSKTIMAAAGSAAAAAGRSVSTFLDTLKSMIQNFEGLRLDAYQDVAGKWTIGYGHLIKPGEPYVPYGTVATITQDEADALLDADSQAAQICVDQNVTVDLTDDQRAALVSFVFNVGCTAFMNSTLLIKLNAGDYAGAAAEFAVWNHVTDPATGQLVASSGLTNRRATEAQVFTTGMA
jgi:lysozyme